MSVVTVGAASASATVAKTVKLGEAAQNYACSPDYEWIQTASQAPTTYTVPSSGTLASWSTAAGPTEGTMQFEVWRPAGGSLFTLVYISQKTPLTPGKLHKVILKPALRVKQGDLLGYRSVTPVNCAVNSGDAADVYAYNTSGIVPTKGSTVAFNLGQTGFRFDIAAIFH